MKGSFEGSFEGALKGSFEGSFEGAFNSSPNFRYCEWLRANVEILTNILAGIVKFEQAQKIEALRLYFQLQYEDA